MAHDELIYKMAIGQIPHLGSINAKQLIAYMGGLQQVFQASVAQLKKVPGIGEITARNIHEFSGFDRMEKEAEFVQKNKITPLFYLDKGYPERLRHCADAPLLMFQKGPADLNQSKVLCVVGTRNATRYGVEKVQELMEGLAAHQHQVLIISGLAYGIDIAAHEAAMKNNLPTAAVLGHGLDTIYPALHRPVAVEMLRKKGALITEYLTNSEFNRQHFLQRNRIVAGLADATIVVESAKKGGALVTADIANSYNRDVFAFPGRVGDTYSEGTNQLIKSHKAALIETVKDLEYIMGWEAEEKGKADGQKKLFVALSEEEQQVIDLLQAKGAMPVDHLALQAGVPMSKLSSMLLKLEFDGLVKSLPGKVYEFAG